MQLVESPSLAENVCRTARHSASPVDALVRRVVFGEVLYEAGGSYGPFRQKYYQLLGVIEGCAEVETPERIIRIGAGEIGLLCPCPRQRQRFSSTSKTHHLWCAIHPGLLAKEMASDCNNIDQVQTLTWRFRQLVTMALQIPQEENPRVDDLIESLGMAALREFLYLTERKHLSARQAPNALWRALDWIEVNGAKETNLSRLAREAGVSPRNLTQLFRRYLGTAPMHYLWKSRTQYGAQLLKETGLSVAEAAYQVGFQTPQHFAELLRRYYGISPRQLRKEGSGPENPAKPIRRLTLRTTA